MRTLSRRMYDGIKTRLSWAIPDAIYWRHRGRHYEREFAEMSEELQAEFRNQERTIVSAVSNLDLPNVPSALDVGCGFGRISSALTAAFPKLRVVGIDSSREMIDAANISIKNPRQSYVVCNAKTPGPFKRYNLVYSVELLMHIRDPWPIMRNMAYSSRRHILHCELGDRTGESRRNYVHDYVDIYRRNNIIATIVGAAPFGQQIILAWAAPELR